MEKPDTIAYKTWVENLQEPAPEGAWNAIADQLDIDATWDNISETLDLDDVWQNVEAELPQAVPVSTPGIRFPKLFWAAAALILLTLTTPVSDKIGDTNKQSQSEVKQSETKIVDQTDEITNNQPESIVITHNRAVTNSVNKKSSEIKSALKPRNQKTLTHAQVTDNNDVSNVLINQSGNNSAVVLASEPIVIPDDTTTQRSVLIPEALITKPVFLISQEADTLATEQKIEKDSLQTVIAKTETQDSVQNHEPNRAKWQIGVIGSIKNTWLINPETTNGLKRSSLNATRVTFGKEFGVTLQRSIGGASDIQFEYYFYSQIGQRYHEYINALYQTKDIRLRYQKFQVVYRTRIFRKYNAPALYALGGIRVSRLTLADTSIGDESQVVTQEYQPWDYGFILGGEAEFNLNKKLLLVSGLRASYGLRNIYLGTNQAPAEFNKTHTASLGLVLGLKYRIN